jgi:hypothetical protein
VRAAAAERVPLEEEPLVEPDPAALADVELRQPKIGEGLARAGPSSMSAAENNAAHSSSSTLDEVAQAHH